MEKQKNITQTKEQKNWLQKELDETKSLAFDMDKKPALKLEENKIAEIEIDFSKPFEMWTDSETETVKKIIPVTFKGESLVWWLNVKNPIYHQIIEKGINGQTKFKVLQTGTKQNTKYTLVDG